MIVTKQLQDKWNREKEECRFNTHLKRHYGITIKDWNKLFKKQNGCCAICKKPQSSFHQKLHVDHDHKSGKVRGLLCISCNIFIGAYEKRQEYLELIVKYLKWSPLVKSWFLSYSLTTKEAFSWAFHYLLLPAEFIGLLRPRCGTLLLGVGYENGG